MPQINFSRSLLSWEGVMAIILVIVLLINLQLSEFFWDVDNLVNAFQLHIEKIILVPIMALIIINGEIDLTVASMMGFSASLFGYFIEQGTSTELSILLVIGAATLAGMFNGMWIAYFGLPSLAVTLAGLIGYRGAARVLLETESVGGFPAWFTDLGQPDLVGPVSAGIILAIILFIIYGIVLHATSFGRYVYIIGNNREAAEYSGVHVRRVKMILFTSSAIIASIAGLLLAARISSVRANTANGFELEIITIVLLGGVSIFGGTGSMIGVGLSTLVVMFIRNGMGLADYSGNLQNSAIGFLLIVSVLIPNLLREAAGYFQRRQIPVKEDDVGGVKESATQPN